MINTVIFDLDGLLIDSETISYQIYRDLLGTYGLDLTLEEYAHTYSGKTEVQNLQALIGTYLLPLTLEDGMAFVERKEAAYLEQGAPLKKGAEKLLSYLRESGLQMILASSSKRARAASILQQNGIEGYFGHMVFGAEVKRGKPFPDIFLKACAAANEPPGNCLVLEDSEAGIQAAHSAGIRVICIPDMKSPGGQFCRMAAALLPSLEEVISWLEADRAQSSCRQGL